MAWTVHSFELARSRPYQKLPRRMVRRCARELLTCPCGMPAAPQESARSAITRPVQITFCRAGGCLALGYGAGATCSGAASSAADCAAKRCFIDRCGAYVYNSQTGLCFLKVCLCCVSGGSDNLCSTRLMPAALQTMHLPRSQLVPEAGNRSIPQVVAHSSACALPFLVCFRQSRSIAGYRGRDCVLRALLQRRGHVGQAQHAKPKHGDCLWEGESQSLQPRYSSRSWCYKYL